MATRTEMDLPAGIREAISTLIRESVRCGLYDAPRKAQTAAHEALVARLLALLAPEPEPSDAEIEAGARFIDGIQFSDQAWEAMPVGYKNTMRHRAKAVLLAAARAARQTGGATE